MKSLKDNLINGKNEFLVIVENNDLGKDIHAGAAALILYEVFDINRKSLSGLTKTETLFLFPNAIKLIEENEKSLTFELKYDEMHPKMAKKIESIKTYFHEEKKRSDFSIYNLDEEKNPEAAKEMWMGLLDLDAVEILEKTLFLPFFKKRYKVFLRHSLPYMAKNYMKSLASYISRNKIKKANFSWNLNLVFIESENEFNYLMIQNMIYLFLEKLYGIGTSGGDCHCDEDGSDHHECQCGCAHE